MKIGDRFLVRSSDGISCYAITIGVDSKEVRVSCDCVAGAFGKTCKHKIGLLAGDLSLLQTAEDGERLLNLLKQICDFPLMSAIRELQDREQNLASQKRQVEHKKKEVEALMIGSNRSEE